MNDEYNGFVFQRTKNGFRIQRKYSDSHIHFKNYHAGKRLVDIVNNKKIPSRVSTYYLSCCVKLSNDEKYKEKIKQIITAKTSKDKDTFYNPHRKSF